MSERTSNELTTNVDAREVVAARQRLFGLMLLVVEAFALGFLSETILFPSLIVFSAIGAWFFEYRWRLSKDQMLVVYIAMLVVFGLKYTFVPDNPQYTWGFLNFQLLFIVAQYLFSVQWLQFFRWSDDDRLPTAYPMLGAMVMMTIAVVRLDSSELIYYRTSFALFIFLATLFSDACALPSEGLVLGNNWRGIVYTSTAFMSLAFAVAAAWIAADAFNCYERQMDQFVMQFLQPMSNDNAIGFARDATLGTLVIQKTRAEKKVAIRVYSETEPGYLRGRAFDRYGRSTWGSAASQVSLDPIVDVTEEVVLADGENLFSGIEWQGGRYRTLQCWPSENLQNHMLAPMSTSHVSAHVNEVTVTRDSVFESDELLPTHPYRTWEPLQSEVRMLDEQARIRLTALPDDIPTVAHQLAEKIFADCKTTQDKVDAVESYFHTQYQYRLGVVVPPGTDPLKFFLTNKPPAHCEYFACAAAVLLRLAEVPTRYVTGLVVTEYNTYGEYWVARNRDAHAWVEAFDDDKGWVTVEATPSVGVPGEDYLTPVSEYQKLWENLADRFTMFRVNWQQEGFKSLARAISAFFLSPIGITIIAVLLVAAYLYFNKQQSKGQQLAVSESVAALNLLLARMDAQMKAEKIVRLDSETIYQFAKRLDHEAAASWYQNYCKLRYQAEISAVEIDSLKTSLTTIKST